jgi:hypothetical protein
VIPQMRKIHKYFGLFTFVVIVVVAMTGILLIHKKSLGLNRVMVGMPMYGGLQAIDSSDMIVTGEGKTVVATKEGVFMKDGREWIAVLPSPTKKLYEKDGSFYACSKDGLHESKDGKNWTGLFPGEEVKAVRFIGDELHAATARGIYKMKGAKGGEWETVIEFARQPLDVREFVQNESIMVAAKEGIFTLGRGGDVSVEALPVRKKGRKVDLQKVITDLHTGEFFGRYFYLFMDLTAVGMVAMSVTGLYIWYRPRKKRARA